MRFGIDGVLLVVTTPLRSYRFRDVGGDADRWTFPERTLDLAEMERHLAAVRHRDEGISKGSS